MTPQLQTSTSGPAYSLLHITYTKKVIWFTLEQEFLLLFLVCNMKPMEQKVALMTLPISKPITLPQELQNLGFHSMFWENDHLSWYCWDQNHKFWYCVPNPKVGFVAWGPGGPPCEGGNIRHLKWSTSHFCHSSRTNRKISWYERTLKLPLLSLTQNIVHPTRFTESVLRNLS